MNFLRDFRRVIVELLSYIPRSIGYEQSIMRLQSAVSQASAKTHQLVDLAKIHADGSIGSLGNT